MNSISQMKDGYVIEIRGNPVNGWIMILWIYIDKIFKSAGKFCAKIVDYYNFNFWCCAKLFGKVLIKSFSLFILYMSSINDLDYTMNNKHLSFMTLALDKKKHFIICIWILIDRGHCSFCWKYSQDEDKHNNC